MLVSRVFWLSSLCRLLRISRIRVKLRFISSLLKLVCSMLFFVVKVLV